MLVGSVPRSRGALGQFRRARESTQFGPSASDWCEGSMVFLELSRLHTSVPTGVRQAACSTQLRLLASLRRALGVDARDRCCYLPREVFFGRLGFAGAFFTVCASDFVRFLPATSDSFPIDVLPGAPYRGSPPSLARLPPGHGLRRGRPRRLAGDRWPQPRRTSADRAACRCGAGWGFRVRRGCRGMAELRHALVSLTDINLTAPEWCACGPQAAAAQLGGASLEAASRIGQAVSLSERAASGRVSRCR